MDNKSIKTRSLFDYFQSEIHNEQLQDNFPNDEKFDNASFKSSGNNSIINENVNSNESNDCDLMVMSWIKLMHYYYNNRYVFHHN